MKSEPFNTEGKQAPAEEHRASREATLEMAHTRYENAIVRNADWFISREDQNGCIRLPADEYYGIPGDASLIGHAISIRTYAYLLTSDRKYLDSASRSARWLADRQDHRGGWRNHSGYTLDAAQCVMEGFCTYERVAGDRQFHETLIRATDRMIAGTISPDGGLLIGNLIECGEYAHHSFLAWKQAGLARHRAAGDAILKKLVDNFDEAEGFWNTAIELGTNPLLTILKPCLNPVLRACATRLDLKGKIAARFSEHVFPLVTKGRAPQYSLGIMAAESLLDALDGTLDFPELRRQTARAIEWVQRHCAGPVAGSVVESKRVPLGQEVYPLRAINNSRDASMWPTAAYLLALVGMNDTKTYGECAQTTADWIVSMQDQDGGFWAHQRPGGEKFGEKYGNVNYYASTALWFYNAVYVRGFEPKKSQRASFA